MKLVLAAACAITLFASAAIAEEMPCPAGQELVFIRISTIKEGGTRAGFDKAVADHIKWYRDHGYTTNEQVVANIMDYDKASKSLSVSQNTVMTIHYNPPWIANDKPDAAWDALVAEYRANSDIVTDKIACLPKRK